MWRCAISTALALVAGVAGVAQAGEMKTTLQGGSYEVRVRLEIPNLQNWAAQKVAFICVSADGRGSQGLVVLSDNNPLSRCPATNIRHDGSILTFDILCEGRNAPRAFAAYTLASREFKGRIFMNMGGKNMTLTEMQLGRRVGDCTASGSPPS